jgi:hypothetical protein
VKVGDLVVRAYVMRMLIPGIIVEQHVEPEVVMVGDEACSYDSYEFTVAWSDGSVSKEMYDELEYLVDIVE